MGSLTVPIPVLNYLGASDISASAGNFGSTMYTILFDQTYVLNGRLLMFEYKLQQQSTATIPEFVQLGYIDIQNAMQSGLFNQWQIPVAAKDNQHNPTIPMTIQVRVYSGVTGSSDIVVSPWSNSLNVHNPPVASIISSAFYDPSSVNPDTGVSNSDDLYVFLNASINTYNYTEIKFILAYYYKDTAGDTVWKVSDLLTAVNATISGISYKMLLEPNFGKVSTSTGNKKIYVAVYAVYPFEYEGAKHYSVSYISNTVTAEPAANSNKPTITEIDYFIYNTDKEQIMDVKWTAPANSAIAPYIVDHYELQVSTNGTTWNFVSGGEDISSTILNLEVDVSNRTIYSCGKTVSFRVRAVSTYGAISEWSNVDNKKIFYYAQAPTALVITNATSSEGEGVSMTLTFNAPEDLGCGEPNQFVIVITDSEGTVEYRYLDYDSSNVSGEYTIDMTNLDLAQSGLVNVYLQTFDTNNTTAVMDGALSEDKPYIAINFHLDAPAYHVYANGNNDQDMVLTIVNPLGTTEGWRVFEYIVHIIVTGSSNFTESHTLENSVESPVTSYTYDATPVLCNSNVAFYIIAKARADDETVYEITSNTVDINKFKYAEQITEALVHWASSNINYTTMDIKYTFKNPAALGCGIPQNFVVKVFDASSFSATPLATKNVPYVAGTAPYTVNFNNTAFASSGYVRCYLLVRDTNASEEGNYDNIYLPMYQVDTFFESSDLPIFKDVTYDGTNIQFSVVSQAPLSKYIGIIKNILNNAVNSYALVLTPDYIEGGNYEKIYNFNLIAANYGITSVPFAIVAANDVGIQRYVVNSNPYPPLV